MATYSELWDLQNNSALLVKNKAASVAAIQGASDTAIQTNVNELVDLFAQG